MNLKTQGFVLIDVDVVALNNAGKNTNSNFDNAVATKKIYKDGRAYTYVSGQAWRYWWRDTLQKNFEWNLSPITRDKKIAFTEANPIKYPDDDIFGYMRAAKATKLDENGNPVLNKQKKEVTEDVTVTRISPLKNSALISVASSRAVENWSSMARQEGDSVPYSKEEYSAIMKGMFSIDIDQAGTFATYNKTGYKNLTDILKKNALENGAEEIKDKYVLDSKGVPQKLIRLSKEIRKKRVLDAIRALKSISGGAMQTSNMADVTPKFIILATTNSGNHPFSHIVSNTGVNNDKALLNIDGIKEVINDYKDQFKGKIFIGKRSGFWDEYNDKLSKLVEDFKPKEPSDDDSENKETYNLPEIVFSSVNTAIDKYCKQLNDQI